MYVEGSLISNQSMSGTLYASTKQARIGGWYNGGNPENADAYYDEYRISNIARWTGSSFTPDTRPYGLNYTQGHGTGLYAINNSNVPNRIS